MMNRKLALLLGALAGAAFWQPPSAQQASDRPPAYRDPQSPVDRRVDDLVSRMTLEEKISQIGHAADAIPRLGIPEYNWWNEGLHGVARAGVATVFPQAIGMAATFDVPLMRRVADVISTEFRAKYSAGMRPDGSTAWYRGLTVWSPNINIFRDPRWGRGQETYGEDPFLTSRMGVAFVTGLQGDHPGYFKTIATTKHFAVHSGPEATRHSMNVNPSPHDLADTYLPAFRATIVEGRAQSVMCAYNSIDRQPACANGSLLGGILRHDWNFEGYVVSDCGAVTDIYEGHHFTKSLAEGVAAAIEAGMDLVCGSPRTRVQAERQALLQAVKEGRLPEARLDRAVGRLYRARFRLGMFDPPSLVPYSAITPADNDTEEHRALALEAARKSLVLLKNKDRLLPLREAPKTIAVIGPDADSLEALVGNYNGEPSKPVTVLAGLAKRFPDSRVLFVEGTGLVGPVARAVPSEALFADATRKEHGLAAEYFSNTDLEGPAVLARLDRSVDFAWGERGATPELERNYSVRWTGVLVPPASGDYLIGFTAQDGYRVWFDGKQMAEDWTVHHPATTQTRPFHLEKDRAYAIKIEYYKTETIRSAEARLVWSLPEHETEEAVRAARGADLAVVVMGLSPRIEGEEMKVDAEGFAGGDRTKIDLPAPQQKLLESIQAAGKPVVLVLMNGSALAVNWAEAHLPAILEVWYPGEEGGTAVAEALAGDFSPGGRLPVTVPESVEQLPPFDDYSMARRTYRYFDGQPLYPFGYGLSYTSFAYGAPKLDRVKVAAGDSVTVSAEVSNTGSVPGDEVVQLYLMHRGVAGAPLRALAGFERIHLARGEKKTVSFTLRDRDLSVVDPAGKRRIVPGRVDVWIGGGQPAARPGLSAAPGVRTSLTLVSAATLPD
jgi:beta-glucosidase